MVTGAFPPLVGRSPQVTQLDAALARAAEGAGGCLLLAGEAGIGKSRLVAEARTRAVALGFSVFEGVSFPFDTTIPLSPFADLLRMGLRNVSRAEVERLGNVLADLASLVPEVLDTAIVSSAGARARPDQDKQRLFSAIAKFLFHHGENAPVLVVLEDLHWADDVSLELLVSLARRATAYPVLLIGTYRSDEIGEPLAEWLAHLQRTHLAAVIELPPFTLDETAEFVSQLQGGHRLRADLLDDLRAITEGNAYFLEEVVKSLRVAGTSLHEDSLATHMPLAVLQAPVSIREAVRRRLSQLTEPACKVLTVAAVAGRRFEFDMLEHATGIDEAGLIATLRELVEAHLVREESPDLFAFRHALTQQAVLSNLLGRERQQLHERVAITIEERRGTVSPDPSDLAFHWFEARDWERAARYARHAGERAMAMFSPRAAAQQFARARLAHAELGTPAGWELFWLEARTHDTLGDFDLARAGYEKASELARAANDTRGEWQSLLDLGLLWTGRDYQSARTSFEAGLRLARESGDPALLARTLNRLGNVAVNEERLEEAFALHGEALGLAESLGDREQVAETHDLLGMASFQAGELGRAERHYEQAVALFRQLDVRYGLSSALAVRALCAGANLTETEPDSERALSDQRQDVDEAFALAEESGWRAGEAFASAVLAWILTPRGEYAEALRAGERAIAVAEEIEHTQWTAAACCALGRLYADLLAFERARDYLERGYSLAHELASPLWICNIGGSLLELCAQMKDFGRAEEVAAQIEAHIRPTTLHGRSGLAGMTVLALARGDGEPALRYTDTLLERSAKPAPLVLRLRAEALTLLERLDEAEPLVLSAWETATARSRLPQAWRSNLLLGHIRLARGDRAGSREAFAAARDTIASLSMAIDNDDLREQFLRRTDELLPPEPRRTDLQEAKVAYDGLTAREREVASLLAQGMANREIAERLTVSERTVEAHVSNVLNKLAFVSRTQIAAWAVEKGLVQPGS